MNHIRRRQGTGTLRTLLAYFPRTKVSRKVAIADDDHHRDVAVDDYLDRLYRVHCHDVLTNGDALLGAPGALYHPNVLRVLEEWLCG